MLNPLDHKYNNLTVARYMAHKSDSNLGRQRDSNCFRMGVALGLPPWHQAAVGQFLEFDRSWN